MSHEQTSGPPGERKKYPYFVDGKPYESEKNAVSGAEIKSRIPNLNPAFQLFLESKGADPDRPIGDADTVALDRGAPHLYTAPPATFGGARWPD